MSCAVGQSRTLRAGISHPDAFTLIELLVVVAIIAILAAIAVPNMLEAQVRAKISRVRSDLRTVATAAEAFAVDHGRYPFSMGETVGPMLTIAPIDPFSTVGNRLPYRYLYFPAGDPLYGQVCHRVAADWAIFSVGPDLNVMNTPGGQSDSGLRVYRDYDPTNGTASLGNVFRTRARPDGFGTYPYFYSIP